MLQQPEPTQSHDLRQAYAAKIDFSESLRGSHHTSVGEGVMMPVSFEKSVWAYLSGNAPERGIQISELSTEVLKWKAVR